MKLKRSRSAVRPPRASLDEPSKTITVEPLRVPGALFPSLPSAGAAPEREPAGRAEPTEPGKPRFPTP